MKTKIQSRKETLEKHYALCEQLGKLTGSKFTGKKISLELFKLEKIAHEGATAFCNGTYTYIGHIEDENNYFNFRTDENAWDKFSNEIENQLKTILGSIPKGFFVNGDARGYALKLEPNSIPLPLHEDWGRYQILSP